MGLGRVDHHLEASVRPTGLVHGNVHRGSRSVCCQVTLVGGEHRSQAVGGRPGYAGAHVCAWCMVSVLSSSPPGSLGRGLQDCGGPPQPPRAMLTHPAHWGWRERGGLECSVAGERPQLPPATQAHLEADGAGRDEGDLEVCPRGCRLDGHLPGCGGRGVRSSCLPPPCVPPTDPLPCPPAAQQAHLGSVDVQKGTSPRSPDWWRTAESQGTPVWWGVDFGAPSLPSGTGFPPQPLAPPTVRPKAGSVGLVKVGP